MKSLHASSTSVLAISETTCDRCGGVMLAGTVQFKESLSVDKLCGAGSLFGEGKLLRLDLCELCLKEVLGPWLRVTDPISTHQIRRFTHFIHMVQTAFSNDQKAIDEWMDRRCVELGGESPHTYLERTGDIEPIENLLFKLH